MADPKLSLNPASPQHNRGELSSELSTTSEGDHAKGRPESSATRVAPSFKRLSLTEEQTRVAESLETKKRLRYPGTKKLIIKGLQKDNSGLDSASADRQPDPMERAQPLDSLAATLATGQNPTLTPHSLLQKDYGPRDRTKPLNFIRYKPSKQGSVESNPKNLASDQQRPLDLSSVFSTIAKTAYPTTRDNSAIYEVPEQEINEPISSSPAADEDLPDRARSIFQKDYGSRKATKPRTFIRYKPSQQESTEAVTATLATDQDFPPNRATSSQFDPAPDRPRKGRTFFKIIPRQQEITSQQVLDWSKKLNRHSHSYTSSASYSTIQIGSANRDSQKQEELPQPSLSDQCRKLLRTHPASPVVLTVSATQPSHSPFITSLSRPVSSSKSHMTPLTIRHQGITLSSLTPLSITLDQPPLLTFNIRLPSRTYTMLKKIEECHIHLLRATNEGAYLADWYAQGPGSSTDAADRSEPSPLRPLPFSLVDQYELSGIATTLRCHLQPSSLKVADHVIVVVRVSELTNHHPPKSDRSSVENVLGLGYADGRYRRTGESINLESYPQKNAWGQASMTELGLE
ncbi:MAG: hypothetical protein M1837_002744 [Sclerophora amabilis]|nr:MAG: hypothetical protein M1837_002744 [Sclerophora amabilis]